MTVYLTIITTVLVITQVVRITQNTISLRHQTKLIKAQLGQIREIGDEDVKRKMQIDEMLVELLPELLSKYSVSESDNEQ